MTPQQYVVPLSDSSRIGEARRIATRAAQRAGLDDSDAGRAAIVASELATNVVRHAIDGEMLIRELDYTLGKGVELITIDRGPGMADVARCTADGFSTGGSPGQGLGAVHRLSAQMDIYSEPTRGTVIYSRIEAGERGARPSAQPPTWCAISVPAPGETECGDSWRIMRSESHVSAVVADGLGHGPLAAKAANEAIRVFEQRPFLTPEVYLETAHQALHATRGAALACARVDLESRTLLFAGVGNICASLVGRDAQSRSLTSHNGTAGLQVSKLQQFQYQVLEGDLLLMHSDGLTSRWKVADYPGLAYRVPALIAAILYRDFKRGRDDSTILVARLQ